MHDLVYHGGGGFLHSEVYNMPIWMRRFHIQKINEYITKKNEAMEGAQGRSNMGDDNSPKGPNVNPSATFNFKK